MRVANGALEDFHVKNCSKIVFFPLGAEILVAAVARNSIVLCNLVSSDRGGMSASMFLAAKLLQLRVANRIEVAA